MAAQALVIRIPRFGARAAENLAEEQRDVEKARQDGANSVAEEKSKAAEKAAEHAIPPASEPEGTP